MPLTIPTREFPIPGYTLRPILREDAEAWHGIVSDPRVYGPTSWPLLSVEELRTKLDTLVTATGAWRWAIARASDGAVVGTCGASGWDDHTGRAELVYEVAPEAWGLGLATGAAIAFLKFAGEHEIRHVEAHTWEGNAASERVLSRCGFVREVWLPAFRSCRGEPRNFWRWVAGLGA